MVAFIEALLLLFGTPMSGPALANPDDKEIHGGCTDDKEIHGGCTDDKDIHGGCCV